MNSSVHICTIKSQVSVSYNTVAIFVFKIDENILKKKEWKEKIIAFMYEVLKG